LIAFNIVGIFRFDAARHLDAGLSLASMADVTSPEGPTNSKSFPDTQRSKAALM
jgi:hypothetical protein